MERLIPHDIIAEFLNQADNILKDRPFYLPFSRIPKRSDIQWLRELNEIFTARALRK